MPRKILYALSSTACVFAIYSFLCYWRIKEKRAPYLRLIAIANLVYCCITIGLMIYFRQELTVWGMMYFLLEVVVVLILVSVELKITSPFFMLFQLLNIFQYIIQPQV